MKINLDKNQTRNSCHYKPAGCRQAGRTEQEETGPG